MTHFTASFKSLYSMIWVISRPHLTLIAPLLKLPYPTTWSKYHNLLIISNSKLLQNDIFTTWERREKQAETEEALQYFAASWAWCKGCIKQDFSLSYNSGSPTSDLENILQKELITSKLPFIYLGSTAELSIFAHSCEALCLSSDAGIEAFCERTLWLNSK